MKTVDKAMGLLNHFSLEQPEIGLNELARMCGEDKATVRRILVSLIKHEFIEQVTETKRYRLGHGFLALAHLRAASMPVHRVASLIAEWLSARVDETVHVSFPGKTGLSTIAYSLPRRGNVINLKPADVYPYHASSSGLAFLAYSPPDRQREILAYPREKLTRFTPTDEDEIRQIITDTRERGYATSRNTVEVGVASVAMPFFSDGSQPEGTIAIAVPEANFDAERREELAACLREAVGKIEVAIKGSSQWNDPLDG